MENTIGNEICQSEHGLSLYIEMEQQNILIDTGASELFLENAKKLGVDLTKVNTVFLSHGHYDHGGGILAFHRINPKAKIVMQKEALGDYWHKSESVERYIGLDFSIKEIKNMILLDGECLYNEKAEMFCLNMEAQEREQESEPGNQSCDNIRIFTLKSKNQEELKCWPKGNLVLKEKMEDQYIQDRFEHEQYIVLKEYEKRILISGCAHNGILNILEEYNRKYGNYPDVVISGFHMRKKNGYSEKDFEVVEETAKVLKEIGILCYTGHCTGEEPFELMKKIMEDKLQYVRCGDVLDIN